MDRLIVRVFDSSFNDFRLEYRIGTGTSMKSVPIEKMTPEMIRCVLSSLVAYEDTGKTPEEIKALFTAPKGSCSEKDDLADHYKYAFGRPKYVYDFELCDEPPDLRKVLSFINDSGWELVNVTQYGELYTVFFKRTVYG